MICLSKRMMKLVLFGINNIWDEKMMMYTVKQTKKDGE